MTTTHRDPFNNKTLQNVTQAQQHISVNQFGPFTSFVKTLFSFISHALPWEVRIDYGICQRMLSLMRMLQFLLKMKIKIKRGSRSIAGKESNQYFEKTYRVCSNKIMEKALRMVHSCISRWQQLIRVIFNFLNQSRKYFGYYLIILTPVCNESILKPPHQFVVQSYLKKPIMKAQLLIL